MTALPPRIASRIVERDGCWLWTGSTNSKNYGTIRWGACRPGGRPMAYVHRVVYALLVDPTFPIRPGKGTDHLDHCCTVRNCVNPKHLEAVTCAENNRRARARAQLRALVAGHPAGRAAA